MNTREIELAKLGLKAMPAGERARIIKLVSNVKRCGDVFALIPEAVDEYEASYEDFIHKYGIELSEDDIDICWMAKRSEERQKFITSPDGPAKIPESYYWYMNFVQGKLSDRQYLIDKGCEPADERLKVWRRRQIERCNGDLGGLNRSFIHTICTYEIAKGCSVGCSFCGLSAGRLSAIFRATDENLKLFRDVLNVMKDRLGQAAGNGMLYFATEPLDNPDYEKFEEIHDEIFGQIPQITTAVATRNIERTRKLVEELYEKKGFVHRFTVLSLDMARKILENFSAEELLRVELLPQYNEAPGFAGYTKAGRELEGDPKAKETDAGTIVCVDGFCINFCDRTITMFTPCRVSKANPKGIAEQEAVSFTDGEDFADKLDELIEKYAVNDIPDDRILEFYSYFEVRDDCLYSRHGGEKISYGKFPNYVKETISLIGLKSYNKIELVKEVANRCNVAYENVFFVINQLFKKGYIREEVFHTDEG